MYKREKLCGLEVEEKLTFHIDLENSLWYVSLEKGSSVGQTADL